MDKASNENKYTPRPMSPDDKSYRDVMMLFSDQPVKPKYWFEDFGDYWSCSCGQINREEMCSNCGLSRELLRRIFVIQKNGPKSGEINSEDIKSADVRSDSPNADTHAEEVAPPTPVAKGNKGKPEVEYTAEEIEEKQYKRRKRITRIILIILIFLILLLGGALAAFYYYYLPELHKQDAANADATTASLSEELPAIMIPIADASFSIYRNMGDRHYEKKEYVEAIDYYTKAMAINQDESIRHKILAAKYSYVSNNQEQGGKTFRKYLDELKKEKYPGIENIYERTYSWKASVVANTSSSDTSTDMENINRSNLVFFHTSLSGGPPDEKLNLYYELTWPDGTSERQSISTAKGSGEKVTTRCEYTFPRAPGEVKMIYKIYNADDSSLLASDSVTLL